MMFKANSSVGLWLKNSKTKIKLKSWKNNNNNIMENWENAEDEKIKATIYV